MDIHQLRIFLAVYGKRSFSRASATLGLSQPTISDHIKNLETELGCRLFDRLGRSIVPTAEAERLLPKAAELVEQMDGLPGIVKMSERSLTGRVVIGASTIPGTYWLPTKITAFRKLHPEVQFEVRIGGSREILDATGAHDLLLSVVGARMESSRLTWLPVAEDELVFAVPNEFPVTTEISVTDLAGYPFLLREQGSGTRRVMEEHLAKEGLRSQDLNIVAVLGSTEAVKQGILEGLGASVISRQAVAQEAEAGKLQIVSVRGFRLRRNFFLVRHEKRTLPPVYQAVLDFLVHNGRQEPASR